MYYAHIPGYDTSSGLVHVPGYRQLQQPQPGAIPQQAGVALDQYQLPAAGGPAYLLQAPWDGAPQVPGYFMAPHHAQAQWTGSLQPLQVGGQAFASPGLAGGPPRPVQPPSLFSARPRGYANVERSLYPHGMPAPATVEDMMVVLRRLPSNAAAVPAVAAGLKHLDSRALAALLKDLSKCRRVHMAFEIFDYLRAQDPVAEPQLAALLDVYTYTTMIAQCTKSTQLPLALNLVAEMRSRGVAINNHTYSAILNVCVKSNQLNLALEVFQQMLNEGLSPNIVTYNILLEVYAKKAMWREALDTLVNIQAQRIDAEVRTYTLVMLACNAGNEYEHTLRLFREMSSSIKPPTTGAYNAVILACCKLREYSQAREIYTRMAASGCECTHTTYILMLQAAEEIADWSFAMQLINHMQHTRVRVTPMAYSAAVSACVAAGQLSAANQVLAGLHSSNKSGMVAPTHLMISLYSKCCNWRTAYQLYVKLLGSCVRPDMLAMASLIEGLWKAGTVPTCRAALLAFEDLCSLGPLRLSVNVEVSTQQAEFYLPVHTPSMVLIAFWRLCNELRARTEAEGVGMLHTRVSIQVGVAGQELDAEVAPMLQQVCETAGFPLRVAPAAAAAAAAAPAGAGSSSFVTLQAPSAVFAAWLGSQAFRDMTPFKPGILEGVQPEQLLEMQSIHTAQCTQAYQVVLQLEANYPVQALPFNYLEVRPQVWQQLQSAAAAVQPESAVVPFDAMCLMDRAVHSELLAMDHSNLQQLSAGCLLVTLQSSQPSAGSATGVEQLQRLLRVDATELTAAAEAIRTLLHDTSLMSSYRVAALLLEGIAAGAASGQEPASAGPVHSALCHLVAHPAAAGLLPSRIAALSICAARMVQGSWPWWPRVLLVVTGVTDPLASHAALVLEAVQALQSGPPDLARAAASAATAASS